MATELIPITTDIILQLMVISFVLVLISLGLNKILGIKPSKMKEIRDKARNLRERVRQAEILGDPVLMQQLQVETMQMMRDMLIKQLIPMFIRCVIFLGIFVVISMVYGQYENWFWFYFLFSLSFSMAAMGLKYAYKKITGKEDKKKSFAKEIMDFVYPSQKFKSQNSGFHIEGHPATESQDSITSLDSTIVEEENQKVEKPDAWKDKMQN
ncbi:MAG: hypothetical protein ACFFDN_49930 [Candidatus Hodarchaeota archaeon]